MRLQRLTVVIERLDTCFTNLHFDIVADAGRAHYVNRLPSNDVKSLWDEVWDEAKKRMRDVVEGREWAS